MKKRISYLAVILGLLLIALPSFLNAMEIEADFGTSDGVPVLYDGAKFKIKHIKVDVDDPETDAHVQGIYDVTFQWDSHSFVLTPIEVAGCYNGTLRVHVTDSVTGAPMQGAEVSIASDSKQADVDGNVYFTQLDNEPVTVRVEADGYVQAGFEVDIACNQTIRTGVFLSPVVQQAPQ